MARVKLALIGAGIIGKRHLAAIAECANAELVAIADSFSGAGEIARATDVPFFRDTQSLLDACSPDGVIVATPTEHHFEPTMSALEAGAHVLVEKPVTAMVNEAETIDAKSVSTGRHVLVGHHRRYYSLVERAREIVRDGTLGQLVAVSGQWNVRKNNGYYDQDWRRKWHAGPILTNLIHDMDLLRYIAGDVTSIVAETANSVLGFEKEDTAAFVLRFRNGALGSFILSDQTHSPWSWEQATGENPAFPHSKQNVIRFMGTEGSLEFPNLGLWRSDGDTADWTKTLSRHDFSAGLEDAFRNQIAHFIDIVQSDVEPRVTVRDAVNTLQATLAVHEAATTGIRVQL